MTNNEKARVSAPDKQFGRTLRSLKAGAQWGLGFALIIIGWVVIETCIDKY